MTGKLEKVDVFLLSLLPEQLHQYIPVNEDLLANSLLMKEVSTKVVYRQALKTLL